MTAQATQNQQRNLVTGPSREELFDGLRLRHEGRKVPFEDDRGIKYEMVIDGIEVEDGSGNNWLLKGRVTAQAVGDNRFGSVRPLRYHVTGYFDTNRRKGYLKI